MPVIAIPPKTIERITITVFFFVYTLLFLTSCVVFKVRLRPASSTLSGRGFRACGAFRLSSALSPRFARALISACILNLVRFLVSAYEVSFPILQNDTVFQSSFQSDLPTTFSVIRLSYPTLRRFFVSLIAHSFFLRLFLSVRPRIRPRILLGHFSLERR